MMRCSAVPGCERFRAVTDRVNAVINGTDSTSYIEATYSDKHKTIWAKLSGSPRSVSLLCVNIRAVKLKHSGPASKRLLI